VQSTAAVRVLLVVAHQSDVTQHLASHAGSVWYTHPHRRSMATIMATLPMPMAAKKAQSISPPFSPQNGPTEDMEGAQVLMDELTLPSAAMEASTSHTTVSRHLVEATKTPAMKTAGRVTGLPPSWPAAEAWAKLLKRPDGCGHAAATWPCGSCQSCRSRPLAESLMRRAGCGHAAATWPSGSCQACTASSEAEPRCCSRTHASWVNSRYVATAGGAR
jgi:hypothetical protein